MGMKPGLSHQGKYVYLVSLPSTVFEPSEKEITEGYRKLHNEELHNLYSSPNIIRMMKSRMMILAGHAARMGQKPVLAGKREENIPLGGLRPT
jgi:hypothetical protein